MLASCLLLINSNNYGCVARNLRGMLEACNLTFLFSLDSHSKQAGDECHLLHAVSFFYAMDLTFPEHMHVQDSIEALQDFKEMVTFKPMGGWSR